MRWLTIAALALTACGGGGDARVRFDLALLWQQSRQSVDVIHVRVFDDTGLVRDELLTSVEDELVLELVAGALRFEVEALTAAEAPSFFGERSQTLSPGEAVIDVPVAVFPAGGVTGTVVASDSTPIPVGSVVTATADSPRNDADAPNQRELPINADGTFAGALLDGATTLSVSFDAYSGSAQATVVRESITSDLTITVAP